MSFVDDSFPNHKDWSTPASRILLELSSLDGRHNLEAELISHGISTAPTIVRLRQKSKGRVGTLSVE